MEFDVARDAFRNSQIFREINPDISAILLMHAECRRFTASHVVYRGHENSDQTFMLLVTGLMKVVDESGAAVAEIHPGELFGEIGVVSPQHKRLATVAAAEISETLIWTMPALAKTIADAILPILEQIAWTRITRLMG
ncbi:hypothetical protein BH09SUM1_BH09SUM1_09650 [soil metagenome]